MREREIDTLKKRIAELEKLDAERKKQEKALRESEERVKLKLDSLLSPEGDIGNLVLADIIDSKSIQLLIDDFYKICHFPIFILDLKGKVLAGVGWQEICSKFHRVNPETCKYCIESDIKLTSGVKDGEFKLYKCKNGMWDVATPFIVGGKKLGNVYTGQFFFDDEPIDYELFKKQAKTYGFNEKEYMAALEAVPRISRKFLDEGMSSFMKFFNMISQLSYSNIKLARLTIERKKAEEGLIRFKILFNTSQDALMTLEPPDWNFTSDNPAAVRMFGAKDEAEFLSKAPWELSPEFQPDGMSSPEKAQKMIQKAMDEGSNFFEWTHKRIGGEDFFATVLLTRVEIEKGQPFLQATVRDITGQKKAEQELKKKIHDLETFHKIAVGRELRMEELKARIKELEEQIRSKQ